VNKLERTSALRIVQAVDRGHVLPSSTEALRPQTRRALLFRAAQLKKIWRRGRPAKQQVAVDRLSIVGEAGTTKRNAYPYAAYGAPAQRDCKLQSLAHASLEGRSNWAWGAKRNNDARSEFVIKLMLKSAEEARPCPSTSDHRFPVSTYREIELAAVLSLDHGANLGAKGVEGEGFRQHVHARLEKLASKRSVLGVSGYEKYS
jgi:hypothetical protein